MSISLEHPRTEPKDLEVKSRGGRQPVVYISTATATYKIATEDFLDAAWYVLTNGALEPDDPRLAFLERVRTIRIVRRRHAPVGQQRLRTRRLSIPAAKPSAPADCRPRGDR